MGMRADGAHEYVSLQLELELKFCGSPDSTATLCVGSLRILCVECNGTLATVVHRVVFTVTLPSLVHLVNGTDLRNLIFSGLRWWRFMTSGWDAESYRTSRRLEGTRHLLPLGLTRENGGDSYLRNVWEIWTNNRASHHEEFDLYNKFSLGYFKTFLCKVHFDFSEVTKSRVESHHYGKTADTSCR